MLINVDLHDHEGISHGITQIQLHDKATSLDLRVELKTHLFIAIPDQRIFFNGRRIDILPGTIEEAGVKSYDTLVLKHSKLDVWVNCSFYAESVKMKKPEHVKAKIAKNGSKILLKLEDCNFFETYTSFSEKFDEFAVIFDRYIIGVEESIKVAVGAYFKNHFANEALAIKFSPKPNTGAQGGFIAHIADDDFFVKNYTFIGRGAAHSRVDKREIFAYRFLQLIGIGAEAHFIPSAYSKNYTSALALHIATKKVQGFQTRAQRSSCPFTAEHEKQLDLIRKLLYLSDLNSGNYGLDEKLQLYIIDFAVLPQETCIHSASMFGEQLDPSLNAAVKNWDLLKNFTEASESIANDCKQMRNIHWREGYDEYLKVVSENNKLLNNML